MRHPRTHWIRSAVPLVLLALAVPLFASPGDKRHDAPPPDARGPNGAGTNTSSASLTGGRQPLVQFSYPTREGSDIARKYTIQSAAGPYKVTSPFGAVENAEVAPGRIPLIVYDHGGTPVGV